MPEDTPNEQERKLIEHLIADFDRVAANRRVWESHWQEVAELVLPNRDFTVTLTPGAKRHNQLYDSTGIWANDRFAAGLASFLTSPTVMWFFLRVDNDGAMDEPEVKAWLFAVRDLMMSLFTSPLGNFNPNAHEMYLDIGAFGTGAMFIGELDGSIAFVTRPLPEIYAKENYRGQVDTIYRLFKFTARQARQFYGSDALPKAVTEALDKEPEKPFIFINVIRPNDEFMPGRLTVTNKRFQSIHIFKDKKLIVKRSGFDELPYLVPRWTKVAGEVYGRSPGMQALPDLKMVQAMSKTILIAAQKATDPPLIMPDDGFLGPFRTSPGSFNYYRAGTMSGEDIKALEFRGQLNIGDAMLEQRRAMIQKAFFVDQLQAILSRGDKTPLTATEVIQRREEVLRTMAPQVGRMQAEFLGPLIDRTFNLMSRMDMLPPPPRAIQGETVRVEFVSPAFIAQRSSQVDDINRWLMMLQPIAALDPETIGMIFDSEAYVRTTSELLNVPPDLVRSPQEVEEIRAQIAQQQQQQQMMMALQQGGETAQSVGEGAQAIQTAAEGG